MLHRKPLPELLEPHLAAELLGVTSGTLRKWSIAGILTEFRTAGGGHRRYFRDEVAAILGPHGARLVDDSNPRHRHVRRASTKLRAELAR